MECVVGVRDIRFGEADLMYGQTRLGILGISVTSILLILYRVMYYHQLDSGIYTHLYLFLQSFAVVFALFLSFSIVTVMARVIKNYIVEGLLVVLLFIVIEIYAVGFTGIP